MAGTNVAFSKSKSGRAIATERAVNGYEPHHPPSAQPQETVGEIPNSAEPSGSSELRSINGVLPTLGPSMTRSTGGLELPMNLGNNRNAGKRPVSSFTSLCFSALSNHFFIPAVLSRNFRQ
jgi:hypothetical protein